MSLRRSYDSIREYLRRTGTELYEDPDFEAIDQSLFFSRAPPRPFEWKRPGEIVQNPSLYVGGASRLDINQGMLGNCWFLAALASLSQQEKLLHNVLPPDQGFDRDYKGIFRVNFWYFGEWVEVVIDDRLPTYNGKLVFAHSPQNNEFWCCLIEKAYAKLHGSYEALKGGQTSEAMEDFTGGLSESVSLKDPPPNLFKVMLKAFARGALMGCSIPANQNEIEAKLSTGLVKGQAYTVTAAKKVTARSRSGQMEVELVRVRNPWGNEREWNGSWGDKSPEWSLLSDEEKQNIGLTFDDDGEFWMSFNDWTHNFGMLEICNLAPILDEGETSMEMQLHREEWRASSSAGGCRNFIDTFHRNPQFIFNVAGSDEEEEEDNAVVIALMQKDRRKMKKLGLQMLTIGFAIYKIEDDTAVPLTKEYFMYHTSTARSPTFINSREVVDRFTFPAGKFCIVPSTFKPREEGSFILRIYSPKKNTSGSAEGPSTMDHPPKRKISPEEQSAMDSQLRQFFDKLAGKDEEIDAFEFQRLFSAGFKNELDGEPFALSTCRILIRTLDRDFNGKANFEEFKEIYMITKQYRSTFVQYDRDNSGTLDANELGDALSFMGFKLSNSTLLDLAQKFSNRKGRINLDDFLEIVCRVKRAFEVYFSYQGKSFTLDDYIASSVG